MRSDRRVTVSRIATATATSPATWAGSGDLCRATAEPTDSEFSAPGLPGLPAGAGLGDDGLI